MASQRGFKAAVVFHGNGVYDGTETTEGVALLVGLSRLNADVQVFAPNRNQAHVVNHLTGEECQQERNVMEESARISRGDCKDLADLKAEEYDAILIPGGFGAAKNLSDFGFIGAEMKVAEDIERVLKDFKKQDKVIGLTCIAPIVAAKVFGAEGIKLTLGDTTPNFPYAGAIQAAESFGAQMSMASVDGSVVDWKMKVVSTPAYMQGDAKPHEVFDGIQSFLKKVDSLVKQNAAVKQQEETKKASQPARSIHEDDLMFTIVSQSVDRLWNEFDNNPKDGTLNFDEANMFLKSILGEGMHCCLSDQDLKEAWEKLDYDKNRRINRGEMLKFIMNLSKF